MTSDRSHIAGMLKAAREERGLSVAEAATEAGIPQRYARLLEGERLSVGIPDDFYLIPFFRRYAAFVGLDVQHLLPEFLGQVQSAPSDPRPRIQPQLAYRPAIADLWKPALALLAIAVAAGLLMRGGPRRDEAPAERVVAAETAETAIERPAPVADAPVAPAAPERAADAGEAPAASGPEVLPVTMEAQDAAGRRELRVTAKEKTWLSIGLDDEPAREFLLKPGETQVWTASAVFRLRVGNAGGISLVLDGRDLPALGESGQVVRVQIPPSLPSGG